MSQCTAEHVNALLPMVSAQRQEQALQYKHIFGQFCCLKSYSMLCDLLQEWGRVHQVSVNEQPTFLYNEYRAPYIEGGPHFSISHCKHGIAVVVCEDCVGIDIESIRPFKEDLMHKTMNLDEQKRIKLSSEPEAEFIRLWTQKEAIVKLQGTGIISDLHHILDTTQDVNWCEINNQSLGYICTIAKR